MPPPPAALRLNGYIAVARAELQVFAGEPGLEMHKDPLVWWSERQGKMRWLSAVARKVLCIPATSAASERLFSAAGFTVTKLRNRLSDDMSHCWCTCGMHGRQWTHTGLSMLLANSRLGNSGSRMLSHIFDVRSNF